MDGNHPVIILPINFHNTLGDRKSFNRADPSSNILYTSFCESLTKGKGNFNSCESFSASTGEEKVIATTVALISLNDWY